MGYFGVYGGAVPLRGVGNLLPRYPVSPLSQLLSGT